MKKYDLIVVGAGILGTFHAYHAAKAGKKVLLLEKDNYPVGSTVQNFGQAVPSGLAGKWFDLGRRSLATYKELQQQTDISVRQNGSIYIASDDDEWQLANELYNIHQNQNYTCLLLSQKGVLERYPTLKEGEMTKVRATVVCEDSLYKIATRLKLSKPDGHDKLVC